jgi:DEAD/DEAH box helicase domain-containing protein
MTKARLYDQRLWKEYEAILEEYTLTKDLDEVISGFWKITCSKKPIPSILLLLQIAKKLVKFKQYDEAKQLFGHILQRDVTHRESWKELSSLYFKLKENKKAEFCLQKYFTLGGGNAKLDNGVKIRLSSSGRLKQLPKGTNLQLQKAVKLKENASSTILTSEEFIQKYNLSPSSVPEVINRIIQFAQHRLIDYRFFEKKAGEFGIGIDKLDNLELTNYFKNKNIDYLYRFQELAYLAIINNQDVCITAPTGNGKTEAFLLPTLIKIKEFISYGVQVLIIYPQNALAKDQVRKINEIADLLGLSVGVFTGDTSHYRRQKFYSNPPEILVTNPDILHYHLGIGKNAGLFQQLLGNLKIVILDEIHTYSGTFGSNMYFILRRLERIVEQKLQFIAASATVANAEQFTNKLLNRPVSVISCDKGRRGRLHFLMVAPFEGMSTFDSLSALLSSIKQYGKILTFQDSHKSVEYLYQRLRGSSDRVGIHRAGLSKKFREETEARFREGEIDLLIATPTLELGVDIGDLEIVVTPPISVNRAIQRIGRAGRKGQDAVAIIHLNSDDPISQYYLKNPERYFQEMEDIFFDPTNPNVVKHQLLCAALDRPLNKKEFPKYKSIISELIKKKLLVQDESGIITPSDEGTEKARKHSIRGTNHEIKIRVKGGPRIGRRSMPLAMFELYKGAYYFSGGLRYRVHNFSFNGKSGYAELVRAKNIWGQTFPLSKMKPTILEVRKNPVDCYGLEVGLVKVSILRTVFGYSLQTPSGTQLRKLKSPIYYRSRTKGLLFRIPETLVKTSSDNNNFTAALHSLVHLLIHSSLPLIGGQIHEIGGLSILPPGYILLFDQATGSGICEMLTNHLTELFTRARAILDCDCQEDQGCPKCSFLPHCSQNNTLLDKQGARAILSSILEGIHIPLGSDYNQGKTFIS